MFWPTTPDARIYFENMNQVYALPHQGQGDVFRFAGANSSNVPHARNDSVIESAIPLASLGLSPGDSLSIGFIKNNSTVDRLPAANGTLPVYTLQGSP